MRASTPCHSNKTTQPNECILSHAPKKTVVTSPTTHASCRQQEHYTRVAASLSLPTSAVTRGTTRPLLSSDTNGREEEIKTVRRIKYHGVHTPRFHHRLRHIESPHDSFKRGPAYCTVVPAQAFGTFDANKTNTHASTRTYTHETCMPHTSWCFAARHQNHHHHHHTASRIERP